MPALRDLCDQWLVIEFNNGKKKEDEIVAGTYKLEANQWNEVQILEKTLPNGCKKTYTARCGKGDMLVQEVCNGELKSTDSRCLGGLCLSPNRVVDVEEGQTLVVIGDSGTFNSGKARIFTMDPNKGIELEPAPGYGSWKVEWGCYCCQHDWGLSNPFSLAEHRQAWRRGDDGNMECMLAWRMLGNGINHKDPVETSALGIFAMIPEFVATFADMMTLTVGRHLACHATCPLRKAKFEANKYAYTKITSDR